MRIDSYSTSYLNFWIFCFLTTITVAKFPWELLSRDVGDAAGPDAAIFQFRAAPRWRLAIYVIHGGKSDCSGAFAIVPHHTCPRVHKVNFNIPPNVQTKAAAVLSVYIKDQGYCS